MAESKEQVYTIPLRDAWKGPCKKRAKKCMAVIKEFGMRHMKTEKVKIGQGLNHAIWDKGIKNPPRKVKVQAIVHEDACWIELQGHKLPFQVKEEKEKAEKAAAEKKAKEEAKAEAAKKETKAPAKKAEAEKPAAKPKKEAPAKADKPEVKKEAKPEVKKDKPAADKPKAPAKKAE